MLSEQNDGNIPVLVDNRGCFDKMRGCVHKIVTKGWFMDMSGAFILIYCLLLCAYHAGQSEMFDTIFDYSDKAFSVVFLIELLLKLIGFEWKKYFNDAFNSFEAIIILLCFLDVWVISFISD